MISTSLTCSIGSAADGGVIEYQGTALNRVVIWGTGADTICWGAGIGHQGAGPLRGSPPQPVLGEGRGKEQHPKVNNKFSQNRRTLYTVASSTGSGGSR